MSKMTLKVLIGLVCIVEMVKLSMALNCFQCANAAACATATSTACTDASATKCKSVFDATNAVTAKTCETACTADADTDCCTTDGCNSANVQSVGSCLTCASETACLTTTNTACGATDIACKTTFDTADNKAQSKVCAASCTDSSTVDCCYTENCNTANTQSVGSCYTCASETACSGTVTATACTSAQPVCENIYLLGKAQSKGCAASCTAVTLTSGTGATCCYTDKCNFASTHKANLFVFLTISVLVSALIGVKLN